MENNEIKKKENNMLLKICIGLTVISSGVALYYIGKDIKNKELLTNGEKIKDELNTLKFLISESDVIPKALQNAQNKLSRKESKISATLESICRHPNDKSLVKSLYKHELEADILRKHIRETIKLKELLDKDEVVYR